MLTVPKLKLDPHNARRHPKRSSQMVKKSLAEVGAFRSVGADGDGVIQVGNETFKQAKALGMKVRVVKGKRNELIVVQRDDLKGKEAKRAALLDNRAGELSYFDEEVLQDLVRKEKGLLHGIFDARKEKRLIRQAAGEEVAAFNSLDLPDIPDPLLSSDNEWGVPSLSIDMQADHVEQPVYRWGRFSRHGTRMKGTWHFYTEDWRFNALWKDPSPVLASECSACVEPNISTFSTMPRAVVLNSIYRKRWMARFWQDRGVKIICDLNIAREHLDLALLGVPKGWKAYATRGADEAGFDEEAFDMAASHAGTKKILFVVYGGGKRYQSLCGKRGWVWIPQENHEVEGRYDG